MALLFTEYDVARISHVLHWSSSIPRATSYSVNSQATVTVIYWAKVLIDHPKNCDNVFVVQYFGMDFGTFNENTIWHQSCASAGI